MRLRGCRAVNPSAMGLGVDGASAPAVVAVTEEESALLDDPKGRHFSRHVILGFVCLLFVVTDVL